MACSPALLRTWATGRGAGEKGWKIRRSSPRFRCGVSRRRLLHGEVGSRGEAGGSSGEVAGKGVVGADWCEGAVSRHLRVSADLTKEQTRPPAPAWDPSTPSTRGGEVIQRSWPCRLGLGARAFIVASRDDGETVSKQNGGDFFL